MPITDQPLPQRPGPMWPLPTLSSGLDAFVADIREINDHAIKTVETVRADAAERILALEIACQRLAADAGREKTRADAAEAVNALLVADSLRREEALEADRDQARRDRNTAQVNARVSAEMAAAMSRDLLAVRLELRRETDLRVLAEAEVERLRTENAALAGAQGGRHRFRHR